MGTSGRGSATPSVRGAGGRPALVAGAGLLVGLALLAVLVLASLAVGSSPLGPAQTWRGLLARDGSPASIIVWQLRVPRTLLAVLVGSALAVAGVVMQALTRNPLAEPGLLGVNAGAAIAVVLATSLLGVRTSGDLLWFALAGAAAAAAFVHVISARRTAPGDHVRLVLAGAALTATLGAFTGTITMFDTDTFSSYRFWVVGSVADRGLEPVLAVAPVVLTGLVVAAACGPALNAAALGDEQATSLGVRLPLLRLVAFVAIVLLCGAATAAAGPVAFVGLVVPHALRLVVGVDQRTLVVLAGVLGPVLVLAADLVGRVVARPGELEVGIVTAFVGAPVLIALVVRRSVR